MSQPLAVPALAASVMGALLALLYTWLVLDWGLRELQVQYAMAGVPNFSLATLVTQFRHTDRLVLAIHAAAPAQDAFLLLLAGSITPRACCRTAALQRRASLLTCMLAASPWLRTTVSQETMEDHMDRAVATHDLQRASLLMSLADGAVGMQRLRAVAVHAVLESCVDGAALQWLAAHAISLPQHIGPLPGRLANSALAHLCSRNSPQRRALLSRLLADPAVDVNAGAACEVCEG